jgi:hypothetical protein
MGLIREGVSMMKRLMVVLVLCAAAVWNIPAQEGDFEIEDGVLTAYRGNAEEVVVPEGVTAIGRDAFWDCKNLTSVTLPASLTAIGEWAFRECSGLISIDTGAADIGQGAFAGCSSLTTVNLTTGIASIGICLTPSSTFPPHFWMRTGTRRAGKNTRTGYRP